APQLEADLRHRLAGGGEAEHLAGERLLDRVRRPLHLERDLHRGEDALDPLPLVHPADALEHDRGHRRLEGDEHVLRELALLELEGPGGPEEEVVDRLLDLGLERLAQVVLGEDPVGYEDGADEASLLFLGEERLEELLLRDEAHPDEELPEGLAGVSRPGRVDEAVAEDDPFLYGTPLDVQGTRLLA